MFCTSTTVGKKELRGWTYRDRTGSITSLLQAHPMKAWQTRGEMTYATKKALKKMPCSVHAVDTENPAIDASDKRRSG